MSWQSCCWGKHTILHIVSYKKTHTGNRHYQNTLFSGAQQWSENIPVWESWRRTEASPSENELRGPTGTPTHVQTLPCWLPHFLLHICFGTFFSFQEARGPIRLKAWRKEAERKTKWWVVLRAAELPQLLFPVVQGACHTNDTYITKPSTN